MPHVEVTCRNCGTSKMRDITPAPPTPFVTKCPDCPSTEHTPLSNYSIQITLSGTEDGEEVELTRMTGNFEHASIAGALADGTLAASLEPLWERLTKHADLIEG